MKKTLIAIAAFGSVMPAIIASQAETTSINVVQENGLFYSVFDPNRPSQSAPVIDWGIFTNMALDDSWRTSLDDIALTTGAANGDELARWNGFSTNVVDEARFLNSYGGASIEEAAALAGYVNPANATLDPDGFAVANGFTDMADMLANIPGGPHASMDDMMVAWGTGVDGDTFLVQNGFSTGGGDPQAWATANGHADFNTMALAWSYGTGDTDAFISSLGGITGVAYQYGYAQSNLTLTQPQKDSMLETIRQGTFSNEDYSEFLQISNYIYPSPNQLFFDGGVPDTAFVNNLISTLQTHQPDQLAAAFEGIRKSFTAAPAGLGDVDLAAWSTPNLIYFPVNQSNLTMAQINSATNYQQAVMAGMDVTGFDPTGKDISKVILAGATGLTASTLASASGLNNINISGTGVTQPQLEAALALSGRTPGEVASIISSITF